MRIPGLYANDPRGWRIRLILAALATNLLPLLALASALGARLPLPAWAWLALWGAVLAVHALQLPAALAAKRAVAEASGAPFGRRARAATVLACLAAGYPTWVPAALAAREPGRETGGGRDGN
ncbi:MAG: hypothetical protein JXA15_11815 [Spirochaetales bacterium]|nr:hypothetical protein [Spirochaetales bacterium]